MIFGIDWRLLLGELINYILFFFCLRDARRRGSLYVGQLLGVLAFGLLLEYVDVTFIAGYYYGRALIMLGPIPLGIGIGWSIIIYAVMLTTDRLGLPAWSAPFADALLALNIDLSMDAIAIRMGMWVWGWPPEYDRWTADWFGVPFGNFFGWLVVVLLYSGWARTFRWLTPRLPRASLLSPILSVMLSEALLYLILVSTTRSKANYLALMLIVIGIALPMSLAGLRVRRAQEIPSAMAIAVPAYFHIYFLTMFFVGPMINRPLALVPISFSMLVLGLAVHTWAEKRNTLREKWSAT